jgi:hypothetical protein
MKKISILAIVILSILSSCSKSAMIAQKEIKPDRVSSLAASVDDTLRPVANGSTIQNYPNVGGTGANAWCAADTSNYGVNNLYLYEVNSGPQLDLYTVVNSIPVGATINSVTVFGNACTNSQRGVSEPGHTKFCC